MGSPGSRLAAATRALRPPTRCQDSFVLARPSTPGSYFKIMGSQMVSPCLETSYPTGVAVVSHKINREIVGLLGWGPAILMQFAHPLVAAGIADHSAFMSSPKTRPDRLRKTVEAMLALTFGTPEQVTRAAAGINAIHDRVNGRLCEPAGPFPAGTSYSAHDPELLRWVHATLLVMLPRTYELFVGPLTAAEKDRYCLEAGGMAPLLGIPEGYLSTNVASLEAYLDHMLQSGHIAVTPTARLLARELLEPPLPAPLQPLLLLSRVTSVGLLPPALRADYGFAWEPRDERMLRLGARLLRTLLPCTPILLRHWPQSRRSSLPVVPSLHGETPRAAH